LLAVVIQLCLGATYPWSVYEQPLKKLTGFQQGPVQLPFSIFYFVWVKFMHSSFRPTFQPLWRQYLAVLSKISALGILSRLSIGALLLIATCLVPYSRNSVKKTIKFFDSLLNQHQKWFCENYWCW
jgi:hypothetical protein